MRSIRRLLILQGITNYLGREMQEGTIRNILENQRYIGTIVANKTHYDFEKKKTVKNPPEEWIFFENAVPPIIAKEQWEQVVKIMGGRKQSNTAKARGKNTGNNPLSSKIYCGSCGRLYWKREIHRDNRTLWVCSTYSREGRQNPKKPHKNVVERDFSKGCDSSNIDNKEIMELLASVGDDLAVNREAVKADMLKWLYTLLATVSNSKELERVITELSKQEKANSKLTDAYLAEIITPENYKLKSEELGQRISQLRLRKYELSKQDEDAHEIQRVIDTIDTELDTYIGGNSFTNERLNFVLEHLLKIAVYEDKLLVDIDFMRGSLVAKRKLQYVESDVSEIHVA